MPYHKENAMKVKVRVISTGKIFEVCHSTFEGCLENFGGFKEPSVTNNEVWADGPCEVEYSCGAECCGYEDSRALIGHII